MYVNLLDGEKYILKNTNDIDERIFYVEEVLAMYCDEELSKSWETQKVKYLLDGLSNYLVWCKTDENLYKHDKTIMSKNKIQKINKYNSKNILFSNLNKEDSVYLGIEVGNEFE